MMGPEFETWHRLDVANLLEAAAQLKRRLSIGGSLRIDTVFREAYEAKLAELERKNFNWVEGGMEQWE